MPLEKIVGICDNQGKAIDWNFILTGERLSNFEGAGPYSSEGEPEENIIPLFLVPAPAGAASPADDYIETMIDVKNLLDRSGDKKQFACRVVGDSMEGAGIRSGDIVIVQRQSIPEPGKIVVATIDGDLTIKRFERNGDRAYLYPDNPKYDPLEIVDGMNVMIWSVVVRLIRSL